MVGGRGGWGGGGEGWMENLVLPSIAVCGLLRTRPTKKRNGPQRKLTMDMLDWSMMGEKTQIPEFPCDLRG